LKLQDQIRRYVRQEVVEPARRQGRARVRIRVDQVHSALRLASNYAEIARVLSDPAFESYAGVQLLRRRGPHMGAELEFEFQVLPSEPPDSREGPSG
jgi:hypothetical protein